MYIFLPEWIRDVLVAIVASTVSMIIVRPLGDRSTWKNGVLYFGLYLMIIWTYFIYVY